MHVEIEYGVKVGQQQKQQQQHWLISISTSPCKMKREPDEVHKVQILHVDKSKIKDESVHTMSFMAKYTKQ